MLTSLWLENYLVNIVFDDLLIWPLIRHTRHTHAFHIASSDKGALNIACSFQAPQDKDSSLVLEVFSQFDMECVL